MSKQESIREGIAKIVFSNGDYDDAKVFWSNEKHKEHYRWMAAELLSYLHSQGVVIKAKCPDCVWGQFGEEPVGMTPCNSCNSTGYIVEPLIVEEVIQIVDSDWRGGFGAHPK